MEIGINSGALYRSSLCLFCKIKKLPSSAVNILQLASKYFSLQYPYFDFLLPVPFPFPDDNELALNGKPKRSMT